MSVKLPKGCYPTMITPYTAQGKVDLDTAAAYVEWFAKEGCDGIFSVCQSSELLFLSQEECVALNKRVFDTALAIEKRTGSRPAIVASGHKSNTVKEAAYELNRMAETGMDALILITNRLDPEKEGDDVWLRNAEALLKELPEDLPLGLYECPVPYNRLVTPRILEWCLSTGRFVFMKDTCCNIDVIRQRLEILKDTPFGLYNANCQTLKLSLEAGAAGFCGIMANFFPKVCSWLCANYDKQPELAAQVQSMLTTTGFTEGGLPYPLSAKYAMTCNGIPTENLARNRKSEDLTEYFKHCTRELLALAKHYEDLIFKA